MQDACGVLESDLCGRAIQLPGNESFIGTVGLHIRKTTRSSGNWLLSCAPVDEGEGYMTEAVRACTQLAFENLIADTIIIRADSRNFASQNVAKLPASYQFDGTMRWY